MNNDSPTVAAATSDAGRSVIELLFSPTSIVLMIACAYALHALVETAEYWLERKGSTEMHTHTHTHAARISRAIVIATVYMIAASYGFEFAHMLSHVDHVA